MITFQELPPGSLVSEARLMERTGLGRTPVREALQRLARERMVEIHPSQGVFVAATSIEAQLKVLELRRSLEELAVRLAAHRATTAQRERILELAEVLAAFDGDDPQEFGDLLKQTHTLIVDAAHNEFISLSMAPLQGLSRRFWFAHLRDPKTELHEAADLHGQILRAICHGDETKATDASLQLNDYLTDFTYRTLRHQ
ncbi:GntR family transcriptional regulator [Prauserella flavalba]|uniref:GntR family transcriptional regulator n=2 Tax=Prauserella flavalba TaxID=1477506 RepID=A0A318LR93_9PSEU|nr:GntR family transcriptional regulator [Prauserella flavalba]